MNRYDSNTKNESKFMSDLLNEFNKMPHGVFDESRRKILDVAPYGIFPIECWEMLPNSDVYVSYDVQMLTKNPTIKRLLSSMQVELRTYYIRYNDCWEGWNNFITKGRKGTVSKSIPYLDFSLGSDNVCTDLPYNPAFCLSLAPCSFISANTVGNDASAKFAFPTNRGVRKMSDLQSSTLTGITTLSALKTSTAKRISALPFVFYNKIAKQFQAPNLLQDNEHWYPENENHDMILPYNASGAVTTSDYDNPTKAFVEGTSLEQPSAQKDSHDQYQSYPWLNVLWNAQRKGDMFNTGSPFPDLIRGDVPTIQVLGASINWDNVVASGNPFATHLLGTVDGTLGILGNAGSGFMYADLYNSSTGSTNIGGIMGDGSQSGMAHLYGDSLKNILSKATLQGIEFSMAQWRWLATMNVLKERLALCDGSYNGLIKALFGHNPKWHNHEPMYCGGSRQNIAFSEVVQTSEDGNTPLGTTAGRGVSAQQNNTIHVHSDDFGMMMTVLVITPDEYHCQGVDKMFSRLENAEQYFPILNNLSPDATLNKELFVSGDNTVDNDVFNHQERFAYYKSRRNQVSGLMALPISLIGDIGAYLQNRLFGATPQFNFEFNMGNLTDNEKLIFASTNQAQFCVVIGSRMKYIAPIPEDSRPSDMGISY